MTVKTATRSRTPLTDAIEARMAEGGPRRPFEYPKSEAALEIESYLPEPYVLKTTRGRPVAIWRSDDLGEVCVLLGVDQLPRDFVRQLVLMHVAGVKEGRRVEKVRRRHKDFAGAAEPADEEAAAAPGMR
ncbi:hypothetical protein SAMN05216360_104216 [Methylobacterium phyllostachyos]|uniref:Uncharacterized protein n=1 Tax=Methylobacterium phyllostachyos TaxID=582672 RepID=A0A1G9X212_9HYPH|nr:hypothetical protein [Methylobacterium phyllostachyos]SDM90727.1 hypothetical protein SAMN05216360_104216 [Methylobacterium phyllostachyos]